MTTVCTIETGVGAAALTERFGDYPAMAEAYLRPYLDGADFSIVRPVRGEPLPEADAFDAYVILGSKHSVYDDLPWIEPLKRFIRQAVEARIPMVGVCFGHQIMAEALGGAVAKAQSGWIAGPAEYSVTGSAGTIRSIALHQDQVVVQPPDSELVLHSEDCPLAGLLYQDGLALSVQAHPEFDPAFIRALLSLLRANPIDPALVDRALDRLDGPLDQQRFFRALALVLANRGDRQVVLSALTG